MPRNSGSHDHRKVGPCVADARPGILPAWAPPSVKVVHGWVEQLSEGGSSLLAVAGPNPFYRTEVYRICYSMPELRVLGESQNSQDWLQKGLLEDITQRVRGLTSRPWGILWALLDVKDFLVEEPLRGLIDQGFRFTGFFKALWEARFLIQEGRKRESLVLLGAMLRWLRAMELSPEQRDWLDRVHIGRELDGQERLDMLLFLLALIYQNGLADRTVLVFDGLEQAVRAGAEKRKDLLRQLDDTLLVFERWSRLGSATGIVLGLDPAHETIEAIGRYNRSFGKKLAAALV